LIHAHSGKARHAYLTLALLSLVLAVALAAHAAVRADMAAPKATLAYSSYLGGSNDDIAQDIAVDNQGNIYVVGYTYSNNLLGRNVTISGDSDIYVAKFNPAGNVLLYLTLFGGPSDNEYPSAIEVDGQGNAYVAVYNLGDDLPLKNPLWDEYSDGNQNGALFKLNSGGSLVYSTLIPLDMFSQVRISDEGLAVDAAGNAYLTGTQYTNFDDRYQIGMLKINPAGSALLLEKYVGGPGDESGLAIAVNSAGSIFVAGTTEYSDSFPTTTNAHQPQCGDVVYSGASSCELDGVVIAFNAAGNVTYSSYHGGGRFDYPVTIDADGQGNILVAGDTNSAKFPLANALQNSCPTDQWGDCQQFRGFVSLIKLNNAKAAQTYSTYLGSTEKDSSSSVRQAALDGAGRATVIGYTNGQAFPTADAIQANLSPGICGSSGPDRYCDDAFIVTLSPAGGLTFSTYLGGTDDDYAQGLAVHGNGLISVAGLTESSNFPVTANALQPNSLPMTDAFLARIALGGSPPPPPPPTGPHIFLPTVIR
jgi:hypothetical protein